MPYAVTARFTTIGQNGAYCGAVSIWRSVAQHCGLYYKDKNGVLHWLLAAANTPQARAQYAQATQILTANNGETLIRACLDGLGIVMMPDWAVHDALQSGQLARLLPDWHVSSQNTDIHLALLYPAARQTNTGVRADYFVEVFGKSVYWQKILKNQYDE